MPSAEASITATLQTAMAMWNGQHWVAGFVLGVYSSYELHEVPESEQPLFLAAVRFAAELKLPEYRDLSTEEKLAATDANLGLLYVPED
jgi:hypothetical protein